MNDLANWLRGELQRHGLTQGQAAVYAGIGQATISDMLNKGHVPKVETLFRLADYFEMPRDELLRLAGHLPPATGDTSAGTSREDEALIRELVAEFRRVPDEWKAVAIEQVAQFRRLAELRPVRLIGDGEETETQGSGDAGEGEEGQDAARDAAHAA
jgi:transcriptional regulator with XRE-family HTH domain